MTEFDEEMERWQKEAKKLTESGIRDDYDSSMDSKYYFSAGKIGATTSPQVANQIGELNSRLNQGLKAVELGAMNQRLMDQVPKEHFTEIKRLNKLTGSEASLHAPIQDLDLAGFTQQGWDPSQQERSIRQLNSVIERAHMMDPEGNTPITVHAGGFPTQKWKKIEEEVDGKKVTKDLRTEMMLINQQTGEVQPVRYEERMRFGKEKPEPFTVNDQMETLNRNSWDREKFQLLQWQKMMDENEQKTNSRLSQLDYLDLLKEKEEGILTKEGAQKLNLAERELKSNENFRTEAYRNMRSSVETMYERFEKYPDKDEDGEEVNYGLYKEKTYPSYKKEFEKGGKEFEKARKEYAKTIGEFDKGNVSRDVFEKAKSNFENVYNHQTEIIRRAVEDMPAPKTWISADDFSKEKVSESVSLAAVDSFKKYGKKSPLILLENVYPEFALSRADTLKSTVEGARDKFVERAVKKERDGGLGLSKSEAEKTAEKLIGVTWDVGHIYMLKKSGYSDEDIKKEAEKIAPFVKHIHLTDNFGFEDSHLPPGLGGVNMKEQLDEIRDAQKKGDFEKIRGIVEAGEFVANYKEVPHLYALSHLGSPLYTENVGPYWGDIWDKQGGYFGGYGEIMPQKYFDLYGAPGFSQLPASLGGSGGKGPERGRLASSGEGALGEE
ncbi:MAG: hypothetical protein KKG75_04110 [Nanoarchaeota archaeon]|nr:hypothetical protein [Nanoarchaeota archaeon]